MPTDNYLNSNIQEIMVTTPSFALKWGNVLITGLLLLLLAFAAWFQYPEFITTEIALTTRSPVDTLAAPAGNQGAVLLVADGTLVQQGTALVAWQDAARTDYREAQRLGQALAGSPAPGLAQRLRVIRAARLGQLRPLYEQLLAATTAGPPAAELLASSRQQFRRWEQAAVARAPQAGIVQVSIPAWPATTPLPVGRAVLSLVPSQNSYLALGNISRKEYAAVRPGQQVLLKVHELGSVTLTGKVLRVAPLAKHQQHQVVIGLASPAAARLYPSFSGSASIILQQRSLLTKFLAH